MAPHPRRASPGLPGWLKGFPVAKNSAVLTLLNPWPVIESSEGTHLGLAWPLSTNPHGWRMVTLL